MKLLSWMFLSLFTLGVFAQIEPKHPRVLELEEKLEGEASKYFSQRFPGQPYFIKVEVSPLRSDLQKREKTESLPYLEFESEGEVDEWDDPSISISYLRNKVKRIQLTVNVSNSMNDAEVQEIKDSINIFLKLIPYRDEIKVEKTLASHRQIPEVVYYMAPFLLIALLGVGFWIKSSMKTLAQSVKGNESSQNSPGPMMSGMAPSTSSGDSNLTVKNVPPIRGDINFFDPIKLLEVLHLKIKQVTMTQNFPTLQDMIILEKLADDTSGTLGALVSEFPVEIQKKVFQLGRTQNWLEAFAFPTQVDQRCFQVLEEINRSKDLRKNDPEWESLLVQLWRLDDRLAPFLKELHQDHAFVILAQLPKSIALKVGKKVFPGSWGKVLEDRQLNVVIEPGIVREYLRKAVALAPYLDYKSLESYKKEKEIMEYVRGASIEDERDLYETLSDESFIVKMRAPFYKIFEEDDAGFKSISEHFGLNEWALALINSNRQYIKRLADTLDDKKRYVFSSALKRMDEHPPRTEDQIEMKERMANYYRKVIKQKDGQASTINTTSVGEVHVETKSA